MFLRVASGPVPGAARGPLPAAAAVRGRERPAFDDGDGVRPGGRSARRGGTGTHVSHPSTV